MDGVFFSYAEEDSDMAMWIYKDLERTGVVAWRYQKDGKIGADIIDEVRKEIENARYFCLLDSPHSRRSSFVREECRVAREVAAIRSDFKFIICLIEKEDDWRNEELFEKQNLIKYIDLTNYKEGMVKFCNLFEKVYSPLFSMPRGEDFKKEVNNCRIGIERKQDLIDLYSSFEHSYTATKTDSNDAEHILHVLRWKCEQYEVNLITPYLALGVLEANSGRDNEALRTFSTITRKFEDDPRGWAGVGAAQFYLHYYDSALQAYERCHRLILESDNEKHKSHLVEVVHNKAEVLLALGRTKLALREIDALPMQDREHPAMQSFRAEILMERNEWLRAIPCFEAAYNSYPSSSIVLNLAQCYKMTNNLRKEYEILQLGIKSFPENTEIMENLAGYFLEIGEPFAAISWLQRAISISPTTIQYRVELALILRRVGDTSGFHNQIMQCTKLNAVSATERYYFGYAFYLLGKFERARDEYEIAKEDDLIKDWKSYEDLE